MVPEIRASDDDRQRVVELLQRHTEVGRLSLDEFSDRVGDVWAARTLGDLAAVTSDLPPEPSPAGAMAGVATPPAAKPVSRDLLLLFAIAALTLVLLIAYMALTR
jgi:hypothetical protein